MDSATPRDEYTESNPPDTGPATAVEIEATVSYVTATEASIISYGTRIICAITGEKQISKIIRGRSEVDRECTPKKEEPTKRNAFTP